ncbi:MAG: hypothetical protein AAGA70_05705 [Pseudomonadota bacterium]
MTDLRAQLLRLLGDQHCEITEAKSHGSTPCGAFDCHDLALSFDDGQESRAWFIAPPKPHIAPVPAVLYCHAHGNNYAIGRDELLGGRPALIAPYGPALAEAGIASLALDLPCFGSRSDLAEPAMARQALWHGKPLFGRMLAELAAAARWLGDRPEIAQIATLGLSMGATHAFWLAALLPEIAGAAHLACFADLGTLVATGRDNQHGPYMMVPGLLPLARTGEIAGLVAPRPQLVCIGQADPLTPRAALQTGLRDLRTAYADTPDRLHVLLEPDLGHAESPEMRREVLKFLRNTLH